MTPVFCFSVDNGVSRRDTGVVVVVDDAFR